MNDLKELGRGKFARLVSKNTWEYCERLIGTGVVIVVAVHENKLILTEQFRPSVAQNVIELPAGLVGDHGSNEPMEVAAQRELLEETGYQADHMEFLMEGPSSAGVTNETVRLYLASGLKKVGPGGGDSTENIKVHEIPLTEIKPWLEKKNKEGLLIDPKIYAGLYFVGAKR